jgi:hypothetical protein
MSVELEEIHRLDDGKGESDKYEQYGGCDEAEARGDGMMSIPPSVMITIRVVVIIIVS